MKKDIPSLLDRMLLASAANKLEVRVPSGVVIFLVESFGGGTEAVSFEHEEVRELIELLIQRYLDRELDYEKTLVEQLKERQGPQKFGG